MSLVHPVTIVTGEHPSVHSKMGEQEDRELWSVQSEHTFTLCLCPFYLTHTLQGTLTLYAITFILSTIKKLNAIAYLSREEPEVQVAVVHFIDCEEPCVGEQGGSMDNLLHV